VRFLKASIYCAICAWLLTQSAFAATYYVDFSGGSDANNGTANGTPFKHAPGMTGCTNTCASTMLNAGDTVTFKGGVTWTSSYPWTFSPGSSSNPITYTTDHTWFAGGTYAQPVFDDGHADPTSTGMANITGGGYVTVNDLKFINCGTSQIANTDKCLVFSHSHDIAITNSTFSCECWITVYMPFDVAGSYSNFTFTGNDFSHTSGAVWMGTAQPSTSVHSITMTGNAYHDYTSQIGGPSGDGVHGDGAAHFFGAPPSDASQFIDGITFCNNSFYGDFRRSFGVDGAMTALLFGEGSVSGTVCNNDFSYSPGGPNVGGSGGNQFQALIYFDGYDNAHHSVLGIYNNSLAAIGTNAMSDGFDIARQTGSTVTFENNIIFSPQYCMYQEDAGSAAALTSDYNILNCSGGIDYNNSFKTYAQWQALGFDSHSVMGGNPSWISAPGNEHLNSGSPARSAGTNLTSLGITTLNNDLSGVARPGAAAWDMGSYQFSSGAANYTAGTSNSVLVQDSVSRGTVMHRGDYAR
jgi:hypothetical protein